MTILYYPVDTAEWKISELLYKNNHPLLHRWHSRMKGNIRTKEWWSWWTQQVFMNWYIIWKISLTFNYCKFDFFAIFLQMRKLRTSKNRKKKRTTKSRILKYIFLLCTNCLICLPSIVYRDMYMVMCWSEEASELINV